MAVWKRFFQHLNTNNTHGTCDVKLLGSDWYQLYYVSSLEYNNFAWNAFYVGFVVSYSRFFLGCCWMSWCCCCHSKLFPVESTVQHTHTHNKYVATQILRIISLFQCLHRVRKKNARKKCNAFKLPLSLVACENTCWTASAFR